MHCVREPFNIGKLIIEKNVIDDSPEYQRESGVWAPEKQQLFLDSIFNGFDIPKIYFHDLRGKGKKAHFAVVDGKQRLHAIWEFVNGKYGLADDFKMRDPGNREPPAPGSSYKDLSLEWQELFKSMTLDIVVLQNATVDDIEDLFSRLNNGEPLNAAEKRNAIGGEICKLIRGVANHKFFVTKLPFRNDRYQYFELSAKLILIEKNQLNGGDFFSDLKKRHLDRLAKDGKHEPAPQIEKLKERVESTLNLLNKVFSNEDPLLGKQAAIPMYYLFIKLMVQEYAGPTLYAALKKFLEDFTARRIEDLDKPEEDRDPYLTEFGRLLQQGTNDINSLRSRVSTLRRYFLMSYPDVALRDPKREFTEEERLAIYILGGKRCGACSTEFADITEMEADHKRQWAFGGTTSLKNGRALCSTCNKAAAQKVK